MDEISPLLYRKPPQDYENEWTHLLAQAVSRQSDAFLSIAIFRLHRETFALPTKSLFQVLEVKPIHSLPHFKDSCILGLVNYKGQMKCCVSFHKLLKIRLEKEALHEIPLQDHKRLLVVQDELDFWIFPVDELYGIYPCDMKMLQKAPVNIEKSPENMLKGIIQWQEFTPVGLLDEELLFFTLRRML